MVRKQQASQRSAAKTSTRKHQASRRQRIASGEPRSTDWECPRCSQWFAKRRNGPENHLRFCSKRPSFSTQKTGAKSLSTTDLSRPQQPKPANKSDAPEDSGSESDSSDAPETDPDTPPDRTRKRHAQRVRNREFANEDSKFALFELYV
jgi:hypothetical protein